MRDQEPISISFTDVEAILINEAALQDKPGFDYSILWMPVLGLAALAAAIWAVVWYLRRRKQRMLMNDPNNLFSELCSAHSLSWAQQRALLKLAKLKNLTNPCLLFLDASLWPHESEAGISRGLFNQLSELHHSLFECCVA